MAREINRLSIPAIRSARNKGLYADGGGLYLQVSAWKTKAWIFRFTLDGKARQMGLGSIHTVSLAEAREEARRCRNMLRDGVDPIKARDAGKSRQRIDAAKAMTFTACADAYIRAHQPSWRNVKHGRQWRSTLATYVYPVFGALPVNAVDTALVMQAIEPIWSTRTETASRVRGRIESILDWATAREYRSGENPARWRGHLDKLLPARTRVQKVVHHAALPYDQVASFMIKLGKQEGVSAFALRFLILTAARTGEVIGSRWDEMDIDGGVWNLPGERMKSGKEHRVPLSSPCLEILQSMQKISQSDYVFPGGRRRQPLSNMAMAQTLKRMGRGDLTVHGFRSSFRDWAAERTAYPGEVAEMALAHVVAGKVEAAYRRGDLFEKRGRLMEDWALYCTTAIKAGDNVTPIRSRVV